ncbi:hypothetical protein PV325_008952 [Microctonus aethiopoides]|uniref:Exonuclease domain-containing protein n=1 Tax=Microctonus aethiopoides TaxID=144406 RepID=A0AA39FHG9_9HYME|nr:hypothetical protein PV325_008952 [Microctonus aethiopoides]KAK0076216.1 hypothetical protein PV326_010950 [Microctonus aethiopoides]KAK0169501.1 hypothetical protein PV328_011962 [Microctonus aethiopoides]
MYESNYGLRNNFDFSSEVAHFNNDLEPIIIIFDIETGGFEKTDDTLQIAAKSICEKYEFSIYIQPTKSITEEASLVNKLYFDNGNLEYDGKQVITVSLEEALSSFYDFLCLFKRKCVLIAHNCEAFDGPRLVAAIHKTQMNIPEEIKKAKTN